MPTHPSAEPQPMFFLNSTSSHQASSGLWALPPAAPRAWHVFVASGDGGEKGKTRAGAVCEGSPSWTTPSSALTHSVIQQAFTEYPAPAKFWGAGWV